jgi:cytochrome c oxidase assembly protein subunit 15
VAALVRLRHRRGLVVVSAAAVVLVALQAGLGALVVLRLLQPELVTAHLGMSLLVLACLVLLVRWSARRDGPGATRGTGTRDDRVLAWGVAAVAGLAFVQTLLGGHTSGLNAGLAWQTWPLYDGAVLPEIPDVAHLVHVLHRTLGVVLLGGVVSLAVVVRRHRARQRAGGRWSPSHAWLVRGADAAVALTAAQVALGVANLATLTSPVTVIPHLAVASWIWTVLVAMALHAAWLAPAHDRATAEAPVTARPAGAGA